MKKIRKQIILGISILFLALVVCSAAAASYISDNGTAVLPNNQTAGQLTDHNSTGNNSLQTNASSQNSTKSPLNIVISGHVKNCSSGKPFAGVNITAKKNGTVLASTTTKADGSYELEFKSNGGIFTVTASYPGHAPSNKEITLNSELDTTLCGAVDFQLSPFVMTKGSSDIIGLDNNDVTVGPNRYLIQVHVNNGLTPATNVSAKLTFGAGSGLIHLALGQSDTVNLGDMAPNTSKDVFFLVEVDRNSAAYYKTRNYTVTLYENGIPTGNTINGLLEVQPILSQNRNNIGSISVSNPSPSLGDTFAVTVVSSTSSPNLNMVNLPISYDPSKVQPISYTVTYGPNTSNNVALTNPGQTNFVSVWTFQAIGQGNTDLQGIIVDRSGVSYHYNTDFGQINVPVDVTPRADLAIIKTASPTTVNNGDLVTFTINVTNKGPNNSTGFTVTDNVSAFLSNPKYSLDGVNFSSWTGSLAFGPLNAGSSVPLFIRGNFIEQPTQQVNNLANVVGIEEDPDSTNNQAIATLNQQTPTADLTISKTVDNPAPFLGDTITYTVTARNLGPNNAQNVFVDDAFPAGLSLISATPSQGTFDPAANRWSIGTLARGASATLTIVAKTLQTGLITNAVTVNSTTLDPNPDNSASVDINVQPAANLVVSKNVDNPTPTVGQNVTFTVTVINKGPSDATGVIVNDQLPEGLQFVSANPQPGTYDPSTGIWNIGDLAAGSTAEMTITGTVTKTGQITNLASVTGNEHDPDLTNNEGSSTINGVPSADLNLVKSASTLLPNNGDTVTLTLTLRNDGPNDATNVVVNDPLLTDPISNGLEVVSFVASQGTYSNGVWNVGDLAHRGVATIQILVKVIKTGLITNIATASANEFDPNTADNTDAVTLDVQPTADLAVVKTGDNSTPAPGSTVNFTITASNLGPDTANNVVVTDVKPPGIASYGSPSFISQGTFDPATGIWNVGTLPSGGTATITFPAVVSNPFAGQINNIAVISGKEFDHNPTNNQNLFTMFVNTPPQDLADLSISKTANNPAPLIGDTVTYTINLNNAGPDDAQNVIVNETVNPAQLTFVSSSDPAHFTYDDATGIGTWNVGTLPHDTSTTLTLTFRTQKEGLVTNTVEANSTTPDPHIGDNKASVTINVQPSADVAVQKTVSPNPQNFGQNVTHTITVTNNGPSTATGVTVRDLLPPGTSLIFVSASPSQGSFDPAGNFWFVGTLLDHQSATLNVVFKVNATGIITNTATKTGQNEFDPDTTNDASTATLQVPPAANITITKIDSPNPVIAGNQLNYTVKITNNGPDSAEGVTLDDVINNTGIFKAGTLQYRFRVNDGPWSTWTGFTTHYT